MLGGCDCRVPLYGVLRLLLLSTLKRDPSSRVAGYAASRADSSVVGSHADLLRVLAPGDWSFVVGFEGDNVPSPRPAPFGRRAVILS